MEKKNKNKNKNKNVQTTEPVQEVFMENPTTPVEENELETLKSAIAKLEDENKELAGKVKLSQAELINYRKRKDEEVAGMLKYANEGLIKELLSFVENYERALNQAEKSDSPDVKKYAEGFKMIYSSLVTTLNKFGVEEINRVGQIFDPNLEQAILVDNILDKEDEEVLEVLQKGYKLKDRVIKVASVKINQK